MIALALAVMPTAGYAFHGATMHAWQRTWYGQDPLYTPLPPYFVPRLPRHCDHEAYAGDYVGAGCSECVNGSDLRGYVQPAPTAGMWMPLQSERLGQIPNDMGVGGALPVAGPGR